MVRVLAKDNPWPLRPHFALVPLAIQWAMLSTVSPSPTDQVVELKVGDVLCVPRGMQPRPVAQVETGIPMVEKVGSANIGDRKGDERTFYVSEGEKEV
ncbi:hypothetical protein LTR85_008872 [Meristemomyces frigidus]|nr:hypothetical protein LTR85_008872 [Meristemomyces frigidus]